MTFEEFLNKSWRDHAGQAEKVASRLAGGVELIKTNDQIPHFVQLVTHVLGEHLGLWDKGIYILQSLKKLPEFVPDTESDKAITRACATLELASGKRTSVDDLSPSDQVRVLATAASALNEQNDLSQAERFFREANEKAAKRIAKEDPANRSLAITGHNLACALEAKPTRTVAETAFMIIAALSSRKFWAIAGTWLEVERAEYRLSQSYLKARKIPEALAHAKNCVKMNQENNAPALEFFFAYEALALAEFARESAEDFASATEYLRSYFAQVSAEDKTWCQATFDKLATLKKA